jgi:hypothetical protein
MRPAARLFLLGLVLFAPAACGGSRRAEPASGDVQVETTLRVENQGFLDRIIYVVAGAQRVRLGQVSGNTTTTLRIPSQYVFGATQLQFIADPIGSNRVPISQAITVVPGDEVTLVIPPTP